MGSTPGLPTAGQPGPMKPGEFVSGSIPNVVSFGFDKIGPPSNVYIQRDDVLLIVASTNVVGGTTLTVGGRILTASQAPPAQPSGAGATPPAVPPTITGTVNPFNAAIALAAGAADTLTTIPLAEGYLLSVAASIGAGTHKAQTHVRCYILRGAKALSSVLEPLFAGYVSPQTPIGWPNGVFAFQDDGAGFVARITNANPLAGAEFVFTVPTLTRWRVICLNAVLTTSAVVASRVPRLQIADVGAQVVFVGVPTQGIPAGSIADVTGSTVLTTSVAASTETMVPVPTNCILPAGFTIGSKTLALQAADQWSNTSILVETWLDSG